MADSCLVAQGRMATGVVAAAGPAFDDEGGPEDGWATVVAGAVEAGAVEAGAVEAGAVEAGAVEAGGDVVDPTVVVDRVAAVVGEVACFDDVAHPAATTATAMTRTRAPQEGFMQPPITSP